MENLYLIAPALLLIIAIVIASWGGKCKKCGSWRNWYVSHYSRDTHRDVLYKKTYTECSVCNESDNWSEERVR